MQQDLRKKILDFIKTRGPVTMNTMKETFGASDKEVHEAIEYWRNAESPEPIWYDHHRGFWWSADVEPPLEASFKPGEEEPVGPARRPDMTRWEREWPGD